MKDLEKRIDKIRQVRMDIYNEVLYTTTNLLLIGVYDTAYDFIRENEKMLLKDIGFFKNENEKNENQNTAKMLQGLQEKRMEIKYMESKILEFKDKGCPKDQFYIKDFVLKLS